MLCGILQPGPFPAAVPPALAAAALVAAAACDGGSPAGPDDDAIVATVEVTPAEDTLTALGDAIALTAVARDADGRAIAGRTAAWASSAPGIVAVDSTGTARAVANGSAMLTATVDGIDGRAALTVAQAVAEVTVTPGTAEVRTLGDTVAFNAGATDANGNAVADARFLWLSSDPRVATVDTTGQAVAREAGTAVITAAARGVPGHAGLEVRPFRFLSISAGLTQSCALGEDDRAYCWGEGLDSVPAVVDPDRALVTLSARSDHACGVDAGGDAWCWGANAYGQLGDRSSTASAVPVAVVGGHSFAAVAAGGAEIVADPPNDPNPVVHWGQSCALTSSGAAWCWGANLHGQLGNNTTARDSVPQAVQGGLSFQAITTGLSRTCGLTLQGVAYCWGSAYLGDGTQAGDSVPVMVSGGTQFATISNGGGHTCALTPDARGFCWGENTLGQTATSDSPQLVPEEIDAGFYRFADVSAGLQHTCAITVDGVALCWGNNEAGQLGDGTTTDRARPVPVRTDVGLVSVSAGYLHSCGLAADGSVWCWGSNAAGQLGTGRSSGSPIPVRVRMP